MASKVSKRRLRSNFNLGGEQAEADPFLREAFYESDDYLTVEAKDDPRCFLIARTGSGKSAVLQHLEERHPQHVVRIVPEDLSLPYVTGLGVMRFLEELDVHLDPLFIALWKHVLLVELIRHRYRIDDSEAKANFLATLRERIKRDPGKRAAVDYLDEFAGRFWVGADQRVREITERFEKRIDAEAQGGVGVSKVAEIRSGVKAGDVYETGTRVELAERFQRIVNDTQLARLNKMLKVLDEDILDSPQNFTYVVIDDLDRDWADEKLTNALIRCLFRAVLDLGRVQNLKVIVALRTNIFEHLNFGERSGGQEEKFRALVLKMRWTRDELRDLVNERVRLAAAKDRLEANTVYDLLPQINSRRGDAMAHMIERTLMRPRDLLAFLNECFVTSGGKSRLSWDDIHGAERSYSKNRLLALRDEWKTSYPGIERVFNVFTGAKLPLSKEGFTRYLDDAACLAGHPDLTSSKWLTDLTEPMWNSSGSDDDNWSSWYQPLVTLLFNIGFIGCATGRQAPVTYSFEAPGFADRPANLDGSSHFTIHPAFRAGLDTSDDYLLRSR